MNTMNTMNRLISETVIGSSSCWFLKTVQWRIIGVSAKGGQMGRPKGEAKGEVKVEAKRRQSLVTTTQRKILEKIKKIKAKGKGFAYLTPNTPLYNVSNTP